MCSFIQDSINGIQNKVFVKVRSNVFLLSHFERLIVVRIHSL